MASVQLQYDPATSVQVQAAHVSDAHAAASEYELPRQIRMSPRDFRLFMLALNSDEEPNEALKAAAEKFKQKYR